MAVVVPFWMRPGTQLPYPGLRQTGSTCVFVSIASALNWLTQSNLTEAEVFQRFHTGGQTEVNFATVLAGVLPDFPTIEVTEFHDHNNPLRDVDAVMGRVRAGAVLVLSLEVAAPTGTAVHRRANWHMITVFKSGGNDAQVWDSNGYAGFLTWPEVRELLVGDSLAIPYPPIGFLVPHGQHHCLLLARR